VVDSPKTSSIKQYFENTKLDITGALLVYHYRQKMLIGWMRLMLKRRIVRLLRSLIVFLPAHFADDRLLQMEKLKATQPPVDRWTSRPAVTLLPIVPLRAYLSTLAALPEVKRAVTAAINGAGGNLDLAWGSHTYRPPSKWSLRIASNGGVC
jgi:hypothetical protein